MMNRRAVVSAFCVGLILAWTVVVQAQYPPYDPGPAPTISDIQHECVAEYPEPRDRTTIGIGEDVNLWIDGNTWNDPDYATDEYGNQVDAYDTLGDIIWTVTEGEATVYPSVGDAVTLTADLAETDNTIKVEATVWDSGFLGVDAPPKKKTKTVNARVPTALQVAGYLDKPPWADGTEVIGAVTEFVLQIRPLTVDFSKVGIKENIPKYTTNWPNGDKRESPAKVIGPTYTSGANRIYPNAFYDTVGGYRPKHFIKKDGVFQDFDGLNPIVPVEFETKNGYKEFYTARHPREFKGATLKCRVGQVTTNTMYGSEQGPFKAP